MRGFGQIRHHIRGYGLPWNGVGRFLSLQENYYMS